jgi:hypothetical protein
MLNTNLLNQTNSSMSSLTISSHSDSNDNLGVWDDIKFDDEEDDDITGSPDTSSEVVESEEGGLEMEPEDDVLLDSWIKELESGVQRMSRLLSTSDNITAAAAAQSQAPPPPNQAPPIPTQAPPIPSDTVNVTVPPPTLPLVTPPVTSPEHDSTSGPSPPMSPPPEGSSSVKRRSRGTASDKVQEKYSQWRVSMAAIATAESNDLDDILADLMKFEEDTKAQLASGGSGQPSIDVELPSPTKVMKGTVNKNAISSEEFMKFMMNLPDSRDLVVDPSKTLSSSKLAKMVSQEQSAMTRIASNTDMKSSEDIFSLHRSSSISGGSGPGSSNTLTRGTLRRSARNLQSTMVEPTSPTHAALQKNLDDFAEGLSVDEKLTPEEHAAKMKSDKIKQAMLKLKEASVQKVVLKAYNIDGSSKMVAITDNMKARDVCFFLAERNHQELGPNWTILEKIPDLHLGNEYKQQILIIIMFIITR